MAVKHPRIALVVALAVQQLSQQGFAQTAVAKKNEASLPEVAVQASKDSGYAPLISTGATKSTAPLRDVPQTVNVVLPQLILDQAAHSLQDVLRNVPGVGMSNGDGQRDQVSIRGFSAISDQFIDGMRDDALYFRDLSNIDRVEVLKGPSAVLYGRGSSGGLINRITKKPQAGRFGEVSIFVGNHDFKRTSFDVNTNVDDHLGFRITGAYEDSGSFRDQGFIERSSISPSARLKLGAETLLLLQAEFAKDKRITDFGIPSFDGRPVKVPAHTYYGSALARRDDSSATSVAAGTTVLDHRFSPALSLRNATRYYHYDLDRKNTVPGGTVDSVTKTIGRSRGEVARQEHGFFNQTDFIYKPDLDGMKQEWLFGIEVGRQNKDAQFVSQSNIDRVSIFNPGAVVVPQVSQAVRNSDAAIPTHNVVAVAGVYAQNQIAFTRELKALLGIRYDHFQQDTAFARKFAPLARTDRAWSPRTGLVWQPNEMSSYYLSYSKSFQPSAESFGLAASNAGNKPEITENHEIGSKLDFLDGAFSVTASLFHVVRSDVKTSDPSKPGVLINVGEQRTNGLELTANGSLTPDWEVSAAYAYLDGRFTKTNNTTNAPQAAFPATPTKISLQNKRPSLTPKHAASMWATRRLSASWRIGAGLNYSADRFASPSNAVILPAYLVADLGIYYRSKQFDVALNLKNVSNRNYIVSGHGGNDNLMNPGAPRELQLGVTYKF